MTREDIKKEALDFSKRKYGEEYQYPMAKTQACCWGFVNGAEWRINSVYHDITELPEDGEIILALTKSNIPMICGPNYSDFLKTLKDLGIVRWAYVKDLIPIKEG